MNQSELSQLHRRERFLVFFAAFFFAFFFAFFAIANLLKEVCSVSCTGAAVRATTPRRVLLLAGTIGSTRRVA
jgi:uncharacterized membrane protein (DUF485 family)